MADKGTTPDPADKGRSRKRQAPTIDLTATEVSAQSAAAKPDEPAEPAPQQHASEENPGTAESGAANPRVAQPRQEGRWNWLAARQVLAGGVAGAAIIAIALFSLWLSGFVPPRYAETTGADPAAVAALNQRIARLEAAIAKLPANDKAISE